MHNNINKKIQENIKYILFAVNIQNYNYLKING